MQQDGNRNKKESKRGCRQSTAFGEIDVKGSEAPNRRIDASLTRRRLLRGAAAAGTISALSGPAGAQQGPPQSGRFIIGTKSQAAVDAANRGLSQFGTPSTSGMLDKRLPDGSPSKHGRLSRSATMSDISRKMER